MAPRTGAKRLLAALAKTASARVALALAVAAFALAGCGGGSSETEEGSTLAQGQASRQDDGGASGPPAGAYGAEGGSSAAQGKGSATAQGSQGQGAAGQPGAKRGPGIAQPKGPAEQAPTPEQVANATVADISLQSPAIVAEAGRLGRLDATYTCDGKDSWPQLGWSGVPAGTDELILFAMNLQPVEGEIFFDWAVAGIDPALTGIEAGKLPRGAVVGTNGFGKAGYSLCPAGAGETYMFALYALPSSLSPKRGFDPGELRKAVLDASGNVGLMAAVYERG